MKPGRDIARLIEIMAALRHPDTGCPWDKDQTFATIAPYTIEEAYEVADAIEKADMAALADELGDLLLQVVYHARIAEEAGHFSFGDVVLAITAKMIRRHPHVFGSAEQRAAGAAKGFWERIKQAERQPEGIESARARSAIDGVPAGLPALTRAVKIQKKAARIGFDWRDAEPVFAKVREEMAEIEAEIGAGAAEAGIREEVGDLLFAVANLARHLDIDPEQALRGGNAKFERRFRQMEQRLALQGIDPAAASLDEMEAQWQAVKAQEKD
ncbi:MAG: nucleoside triphosphate pyrophosphohydrolase [Rhodobiaceae bacterium]|nr:nucleoside triphosphate pyrophosphohydrolase [Rhodobiaceae bacterium]